MCREVRLKIRCYLILEIQTGVILIKINLFFLKREGRLMRISDEKRSEKYLLALSTPKPLVLM